MKVTEATKHAKSCCGATWYLHSKTIFDEIGRLDFSASLERRIQD
jgi:hypothetical protein